jgi:hypothetical protein
MLRKHWKLVGLIVLAGGCFRKKQLNAISLLVIASQTM